MPKSDTTIELNLGPAPGAAPVQAPIRYFGDYLLLGEIARGGMGVVYRAQQIKLNRPVALKMIASGLFAGSHQIQRFRTEARAAASLNHPHLIHVYEVGERDGQHFLSMELVEGESLADRLSQGGHFTYKASAALVAKLARAIHHAHQHGVLHRDLKPGNVLLDEAGEPRIADFGLAKLVDSSEAQTVTGAVFGTPGYMSPEQASGKPSDITIATDTYSLGAILYQLLTNQPPFRADNFVEALDQIKNRQPVPPRSLNPDVPADLQTVCLKCLEKESHRRYATAEALAEDLERWLRHEPIQARPVSDWERFWKWTRRHPLISALTTAVILSVIVGSSGVTWQWRRAEGLRRRAEDNRTRLRLQRAEDHFDSDNSRLALAELAQLLRDQPTNRAAAERLVNSFHQRVFLLPVTNVDIGFPPAQGVVDTGADGKLFATVANDVDIHISDGLTNVASRVIERAHDKVIRSLRFSADGARLVTGSADGLAKVWEVSSGRLLFAVTNSAAVYCAEISPDARHLVTGSSDGMVRLWQMADGPAVQTVVRQQSAVNAARFSPDSRLVLIATADGSLRVLHADSGEPASERAHLPEAPEDARFAGNSRKVAARLENGEVLAFRLSSSSAPAPSLPFPRSEQTNSDFLSQLAPLHSGVITFLDRSVDGTKLATGCTDKAARLWDAATLQPLTEPLVHEAVVNCARFSSDGLRLITSTAQPTKVRVWDVATGLPLCDWIASEEAVSDVRFSDDHRWVLANAGWKWPFYISDTLVSAWLPDLAEAVAGMRLNPGGMTETVPPQNYWTLKNRIAAAGETNSLTHWAKEFLNDDVKTK